MESYYVARANPNGDRFNVSCLEQAMIDGVKITLSGGQNW